MATTTSQTDMRAATDRETVTLAPPIDIYETDTSFVLVADMPGVAPEGLELIVERSTLPLWVTLGNLAAFLSLNLFILNLLPLPALDGGRLVFVILEMLRGGRKIAPEREGMVHFVGLLLLLTLMFAIGFQDIMRLVRGESFIP